MTNQGLFPNFRSLESIALDQTEKFMKPRTFLDLIYTLFLILWWLFAFNSYIRSTLFFVVLTIFFFTPIYMMLWKPEKSSASMMNRAIKLVIFFIFIQLTSPQTPIFSEFDNLFILTYAEIERFIICFIIPFVVILKSFSLESLNLGYFYYLSQILRSFWKALIIIFIFKGLNIFIPPTNIPFNFDIVLFIAYILYVFSSFLPISRKKVKISAETILEQYQAFQSPGERVRDVFLISGIIIIILNVLGWIQPENQSFFSYIAVISLILGFVFIFAPKEQNGVKNFLGSLSGGSFDPNSDLGSRVHNFVKTIQQTSFQKPETIYTISDDKVTLLDKGKTILKANKGAIAIPTVTDKGTALVLVGKSEMETTDDSNKHEAKEIDGTTTIWLNPEEWAKIKNQLTIKNLSTISESELLQVGINTKNELSAKAESAFNTLKNWKGPQGIFNSFFDPTPSKYAITETKDYTSVRLPGIQVFESKQFELVNILGGVVKVIEIKEIGTYVQILGGIVTVIEKGDYTFVQTPVVSVIDTPKGEMVRVFGIDIQDGEKIDLAEFREKIITDHSKFNQLFTARLERLFETNPQLLLTESKGERLGFLVGEDSLLNDSSAEQLQPSKILPPPSPPPPPKPLRSRPKIDESKTLVVGKKIVIGTVQDNKKIAIEDIEKEIYQVESLINEADDKFLSMQISENKHTEIVTRLEERKSQLLDKLYKIKEQKEYL